MKMALNSILPTFSKNMFNLKETEKSYCDKYKACDTTSFACNFGLSFNLSCTFSLTEIITDAFSGEILKATIFNDCSSVSTE